MIEELSQKNSRLSKISLLSQKVLSEIDAELKRVQNDLDREFSQLSISEAFTLYKLREFFNKIDLFMHIEFIDFDRGLAVYTVSVKMIDMWLQEDFNCARLLLLKARKANFHIDSMLNEQYFGNSFTSVIDEIIYENKIKEEIKND